MAEELFDSLDAFLDEPDVDHRRMRSWYEHTISQVSARESVRKGSLADLIMSLSSTTGPSYPSNYHVRRTLTHVCRGQHTPDKFKNKSTPA